MNPPIKLKIGQRFTRLTIVGYLGSRLGSRYWRVRRDCGTERELTTNCLTRGNTKSCGCYHAEFKRTHGLSSTKAHHTWAGILTRCHTKTSKDYPRYGGRGLKVCEAWRNSFEQFFADMGHPPTPAHSIDRIDNERGYEPGNCRWATVTEQQRNRRSNVHLTAFGETKTVVEWLEDARCPVEATAIYQRIHRGWSHADAITKPSRNARRSA